MEQSGAILKIADFIVAKVILGLSKKTQDGFPHNNTLYMLLRNDKNLTS